MAAEDTAKADACKEYQSSLEDLTFNSKPHINNLTILAEENLKYSPEIVKLIEAQITKAPASEKLPVMYLMDSIVKNVGGSYISLFAQNLSPIFSSVFEKVDESTRKSLFKLRSTWDEMFQLTKLYALDVKINKLDPAWPIKPLPPNVNSSSIHVNPKFLNRSLEEPTTSSSTVAPINSAKQNIAESQKNVTQEQEQFIRQQLLAKQKQLLELQQKKLELELEQTKAQLMASLASQHTTPDSAVNLGHAKLHVPITKVSPMLSIGTGKPTPATVRPLQQESTELEKLQAPNVSDTKASNRDPRINRLSQQSTHSKDPVKKESQLQTEKLEKAGSKRNSPAGGSSERAESQISSSKQEKDKTSEKLVRKESKGSEGKSKLVSPAKNKLPVKNTKKTDTEKVKVEVSKRDPRLRKSSQDKTDKVETKEKRTNVEKKEDDQSKGAERKPSAIRNKAINGILLKNEKDGKEVGKDASKSGGFNFRTHSRSSRSRSPRSRSPRSHSPISRSPVSRSARQRGRLSPKRRRASVSPLSKTQDKEKSVKRPLSDEYKQNTNNWERRDVRKKGNTKPEVRDPRKLKRTREDRCQEQQVARPENRNSPRSSPEPKENVENWHDQPSAKRWKSGWEEAKSLKQKQETPSHGKFPHQPKEVYSGSKGILSPRTPRQQRMSVDANLQIPKELTSANKRDLLKKANQRLAAGEISYDEFLVVAHQINQLFQYQEEKSRSSDWQGTHVTPRGFKTELKGESPLARTQADMKREESRSHCDRHSEERPYDATQRSSGLVENTRLRSGAHEIPQRFREIADRPAQGKSGSGRNLEKLRTEEPIEPDRTWLRSRNGSPSCDGCIAGSRVRLQEPPEQVIQPIDGAPEQPCRWIEGIPRQPNAHFDGPGGSRVGQPGACFDGPHRGLPGVCFDCPGSLHLGQPGVRFDGPGGPRSGLRFDSSRPRQPGPRFDGPRMGQPGLRFDGPRPGQPGLRFEGPHPGQPGTRFGGPHPGQPGTCFDSPCGHPGQSGIHFEGPQSGPRIDSSHPGQPCGHYDSPGGHPGQTGTRFGPHSGQLGSQLDNPGNHRGHARFDPHPGQPAIHFDGPHPRQPGTRFDSPDGLGQPCMRFDGSQPGHPNMRFDGPGPRLRQPVTCFDGPHPGQPNTHFDSLGGRPAQCAVRFDGPQIGQAGTHFDSSGNHPGQPAIRFDGPAGTRYDIISTQPGTFFDNSRGPQFEGTSMNPDPRCSVAGHLFNGHPPSSQYQGRVFDGQPGPRFNVPQGSHYNESAVHGATTLANPAYGPTGPCFEGQTSIPRLAGPHNNDQYDSACGTFYNNNLPASLPENMRQLQPVNTMTGFSHNPIPFSQSQQYVTPQSSVPVSQIQQGSSFAPLDNHLGQLDVNELFSKLLSTGILKPNPVDSAPTQSDVVPEGDSQVQAAIEDDEEEENEENIPDLTGFQIEELKQRYDGVIGRLYTGIQCYSCGMRFTASQTDVYADHLDWHYRMNRMEKDITKKVTYRKWYYSLTDWIEFEEIADLEERAKSQFFEKVHEEVVQRTQEAAKEKEFQSVPAGPAGVHEVCEICQEAFEQYWDEDEEEWHLKNAIRVDSRTYHPACYEDYKNASFTDTTPSPSEAPIENPLHSVLKQEQLTGSSKTSDATNSCEDTGNERSCVLTNDNKTEKDSATVKVEAV
ncbi:pre-mRNA cleavage complex 2 protein Pcf11 isoform X3 [Chiloscyllium plagiosum]|uniref:pre-mRNA cleavage complex 2 protein Pcf11 isoform X3 n=1 Tax=Chiloscyllium plagiosum TaxID=36176 RepID=UPI001CB8679C|nr:pre-mRNA cleavage complex 2 protein Pcf11 isoform X3 [Chiloscyllium plagiosum]